MEGRTGPTRLSRWPGTRGHPAEAGPVVRTSSSRRPPGQHKQLWDWCQRHTDPNIKRIGVYGLRMYSLRISADYYAAPIPNLALEVKTQVSRAQAFEGFVARIEGKAPPPALWSFPAVTYVRLNFCDLGAMTGRVDYR
jgi:hypothetical protein